MGDRSTAPSLAALFDYGKRRIAAQRYPGARHTCRPFSCPECGLVPLALRIEHHTGSKKSNFRGVVFGHCSVCKRERQVFSFTGKHRSYLREEMPACACGKALFFVGMVERYESEEGLPGFFDEGVIVGECAACGRRTAFLFTD